MAYREVTMIEITEVLRQWVAGARRKQIARRLGLEPKTVRRYLRPAARGGLKPGMDAAALTEERLAAILTGLRAQAERRYGDPRASSWRRRRSTASRPPSWALGVAPGTIPVVDGAPGGELYVDTGWMTMLEPDGSGRRRRFPAWIFTPGVSRYRFVYPCSEETTAGAIAACEAAWAFYGGEGALPSCTPLALASARTAR